MKWNGDTSLIGKALLLMMQFCFSPKYGEIKNPLMETLNALYLAQSSIPDTVLEVFIAKSF